MPLKVCALLIPKEPTPRICMEMATSLRATLTERYPSLALPQDDIELLREILAGVKKHQKSHAINKKHTTQVGSLIGGN